MWCGFLGVPSLTVGFVYVILVVEMNLCDVLEINSSGWWEIARMASYGD